MGVLDNSSMNIRFTGGSDDKARSTDTINYITDLLGELQTIAQLSGQADLSQDLVTLIAKHMTGSVRLT